MPTKKKLTPTDQIEEYVVATRTWNGITYRTISMRKDGEWFFWTFRADMRREMVLALIDMAIDSETGFDQHDAAYVARDVRAN